MSLITAKTKGGQHMRTTSAWLVSELREEIVSRKIAAGDRLTVTDLAARFGVSGAPVREAIVQLGAEGYLDIQPNRGAVARIFGVTELRQIFAVREALESYQTRLFASVAKSEDIDRLEQYADQFADLVAKGRGKQSSKVNTKFHSVIIGHDGNVEIMSILERHRGVAMMMRHDFGRSDERMKDGAVEHHQIVRALRQGDGEEAARIAAKHVRGTLADIEVRCEKAQVQREGTGT